MRADFATSLPERRAAFDEAWRALTVSDWSPVGLDAAHRVVHSLAGACETFGFAALGQAARALNDTLHGMADAADVPDDEARMKAMRQRSNLLQAFDDA
jgi:HPt (histidine-containing phosphotransfer) domain-containing protein